MRCIEEMWKGLKLIADKYDGAMTCAEHDELHVGIGTSDSYPIMWNWADVPEDVRKAMETYGWAEEDEAGCWRTFT